MGLCQYRLDHRYVPVRGASTVVVCPDGQLRGMAAKIRHDAAFRTQSDPANSSELKGRADCTDTFVKVIVLALFFCFLFLGVLFLFLFFWGGGGENFVMLNL